MEGRNLDGMGGMAVFGIQNFACDKALRSVHGGRTDKRGIAFDIFLLFCETNTGQRTGVFYFPFFCAAPSLSVFYRAPPFAFTCNLELSVWRGRGR